MRAYGTTLPELAVMAAGNQAKTLADIVLLNEHLGLEETWCRGQLAYQSGER
ncbi:hypothetical protein [Salicibibacter kimchii]|uniref:hypothetical protein n=1 Tax=Salicibibacter kimchii TaxID=2099786 RepID=UPI001359B1A1|nr:hypothetical protein [Salicibibacter kimchii]